MKVKLFFSIMFLLITTQLEGTIRYVPGDYSSIQQAIDVSTNGDTVLIASDTYYENINFDGKNIIVGSQYLTTNDTSYISQTVIDGSETDRVVTINNNEDTGARLIGLTICNGKAASGAGIYVKDCSPRISHCIIENNTAESSNGSGGGIYLQNSHSIVSDCEVKLNAAIGMDTNNGFGGGISFIGGEVKIVNCYIHENQATFSSGGISAINTVIQIIGCVVVKNWSYVTAGIGFQDSEARVINCTLANNSANGASGGLYFIRSSPVIHNCIIWYNTISSGFENIDGWGGTPDIFYSNVQGGWEELEIMDLEPMFQDTTSGNFHLTNSSPCIDAGDPDTTGLNLPPYDLNGNYRIRDGNEDGTPVIDMGAYEYGSQSVEIKDENRTYNPKNYYLEQNYPNPFNPYTTITINMPKVIYGQLAVYNIKGEKIKLLHFGKLLNGRHSFVWDGTDSNGSEVAGGIYIYKYKSPEFNQARRMVLMK